MEHVGGVLKTSGPADSKSVPGFNNWQRFVGEIEQNKISDSYENYCINGGVACSHGRAVTYYLNTNNNENVYPSVPCQIRFSLSDVLNLASANLDPTPCRPTGDSKIYLQGKSTETSFRNNNERNTKLYTHIEQSFAESIWCNVWSWCCWTNNLI